MLVVFLWSDFLVHCHFFVSNDMPQKSVFSRIYEHPVTIVCYTFEKLFPIRIYLYVNSIHHESEFKIFKLHNFLFLLMQIAFAQWAGEFLLSGRLMSIVLIEKSSREKGLDLLLLLKSHVGVLSHSHFWVLSVHFSLTWSRFCLLYEFSYLWS
jgi:hypothetical protein